MITVYQSGFEDRLKINPQNKYKNTYYYINFKYDSLSI